MVIVFVIVYFNVVDFSMVSIRSIERKDIVIVVIFWFFEFVWYCN